MTDTGAVRARAAEFTDSPALLGEPVPVRDAAGGLTSWFVPLVSGDLLAGFVELEPDLTHHRTSWFGQPSGSLAGCPPAAWWLDPGTVRSHAAAALLADEIAGTPYLSFDGSRDRLAWAVPVRGPGGHRLVYVAGEAAWSGPAAGLG